MALKVGDLYVSVTASVAGFTRGMKQVAEVTEQTAKQVKRAVGDIAQVGGILTAAMGGAIALAAQYDGAVHSALENVKGEFAAVAVQVGRAFLPALREVANVLGQVAGWLRDLDPALKAQIANWASTAAQVTFALIALSKTAGIVSALSGLFATLIGIFGSAFLPVIVGAGAAGLAVGAFYHLWTDLNNQAKNTVLKTIGVAFEILTHKIRVQLAGVMEFVNVMLTGIGEKVRWLANQAAALADLMGQGDAAGRLRAFGEAFNPESVVSNVAETLKAIPSIVGGAVSATFKYSLEGYKRMIDDLKDSIGFGKSFAGPAVQPKDMITLGPAAKVDEQSFAVIEMFDHIGAKLREVVATIDTAIGTFVGKLGTVGDSIQNFMGALKSSGGDPLAVVISVALDILSKSTQFQTLVTYLDSIFQSFADSFGVVLEFFMPVFELLTVAFAQIAGAVKLLTPVLRFLGEVAFSGFFAVLKGLGLVVLGIAIGLGSAWNGIVSAIQGIFNALGSIKIFGGRPLGFLSDWAAGMESAKAPVDSMTQAFTDLLGLTWEQAHALAEQTVQTEKSAKAAQKVSESLSNMPSGYKLAAARFGADAGTFAGAPPAVGGGLVPGPASGGSPVTAPPPVTVIVQLDGQEVMSKYAATVAADNNRRGRVQPLIPRASTA